MNYYTIKYIITKIAFGSLIYYLCKNNLSHVKRKLLRKISKKGSNQNIERKRLEKAAKEKIKLRGLIKLYFILSFHHLINVANLTDYIAFLFQLQCKFN